METYLVPMWVVECGVQRDGCISMVKAADAQATVEALQREWDRLREALEEIACDIAGSPKRKLMIADDNFWATPGEHTLRQWIARAALTPAGGGKE